MKTGLTYISNVRWGINGPRVGEPKSDVGLYTFQMQPLCGAYLQPSPVPITAAAMTRWVTVYMATEMTHLVNHAVGRREFRAENRTWGRFLASIAPAPCKIVLFLLRARCFSCNLASTNKLQTANWLSNTEIAGLVNCLTHTRPKLKFLVATA